VALVCLDKLANYHSRSGIIINNLLLLQQWMFAICRRTVHMAVRLLTFLFVVWLNADWIY